ncbi:MAG: glycosyltransferase family 4 protein [FCB group bacterium]|jgi:glycosyltransferase involved in cell wall biosynthesis|nr:glycosyltransferase family 4 protein [FCB group bacterium]
METDIRRIAAVGGYLPRQCGISTFTTDLCESIATQYPDTRVIALPVNDRQNGYSYPERVRFELVQREIASYRRAADFLNINDVDTVSLQHEFGIFGGPAGSHVLALLNELRTPIVTTLHTVLQNPDPEQRRVMAELIQLSDRLVVMSSHGADFLRTIYDVPESKIDLIPHGIPDVPFVDPNYNKDKFGVEGKTVLLTFGLLSPNKGIENVINALPAIVERHPDVVYIVLGATHPHLRRDQGETYRLSLEQMARDNGVGDHVIFHNRFVSIEELIEFLGVANIYVTPYYNMDQIVSGTLAYALGAGKAIISTPYWYAQELLADGRGILVPPGDTAAIADNVIALLEDETELNAMRKRAYVYGRDMIWSQVAQRYMESFERARTDRCHKPRGDFVLSTLERRPGELPPLNLDHLRRMTDDTGMLQHATFSVPNYDEGYTTDDNARALILSVLLEEVGDPTAAEARQLGCRYLAFLNHAFNPQTDRFRNFFSYSRTWLEETGSEDSHGRALWALGTTAGRSNDPGLRGLAGRLFDEALPVAVDFESPRAWAFSLMGIMDFMRRFYGHREAQLARTTLAERLLEAFRSNGREDWPWCENRLSYCNAKLPHALMLCGHWLERSDMVDTGLQALEWLMNVQREDGHFVPIGCHGWYNCDAEKARFDQQPVEAHASVSACLEAYRITGQDRWLKEARRTFEWFLGRNDLRAPLYNPMTGGCHDGLAPDRVNQNEGAESTLSFLLSLMEMRLSESAVKHSDRMSDILAASQS